MNKTPYAVNLNCWLRAAVIVTIAVTTATLTLPPLAATAQRHTPKDGCTDANGHKSSCSKATPNVTLFVCPIENRMGVQMTLDCDDDVRNLNTVMPGRTVYKSYGSIFDPLMPGPFGVFPRERTSTKVSCTWECAGNTMTDVVVWDEEWPEADSCEDPSGNGRCRVVYEGNREVVLVTRAGRRVLGDVAVKECSKNLFGWLPFGLGCTYPKHDHPYVGDIS